MLKLSDRMKQYEACSDIAFPTRMPIVIRVDGKAFSSWTAGLTKPFDGVLTLSMANAAILICETIQGSVLAYGQSDEISILINGYKTLQTQPPFNNRLQKLCSIAASCASAQLTRDAFSIKGHYDLALFDARVFILPEDDVCNYFIWRQRDAERNSLQSLAQSLASPKELHGLKRDELQELCFQRGTNWNDLLDSQKRGWCVYRHTYQNDGVNRSKFVWDTEIPQFSKNRDYIEKWIKKDE